MWINYEIFKTKFSKRNFQNAEFSKRNIQNEIFKTKFPKRNFQNETFNKHTVVMDTKAHQNPSQAPCRKELGNSSGFQ